MAKKSIEYIPLDKFIDKAIDAAKYRADKSDKKKHNEFNITPEYMLELWQSQRGRCAISKETMTRYEGLGKNSIIESNGSIDRIDNKKGYIVGNVQWTTWEANRMKGRMDIGALIHACESIIMSNITYYGTLLPQIRQVVIA